MKRIFWCCAALVSVLSMQAANGNEAAARQWALQKAKAWYAAQPWLVGANFIPSTAINQLEMWQAETFDPETIDRELGWAAAIGMNTMRVYLHDLLWQQDAEGFLKRINTFLEISQKHGIKPIFVLFDAVWDPHPAIGKQRDPKPHVHNSGWVQSRHINILKDETKLESLEPYVKGVIRRFKEDPRVLMWDLYNEPGNTGISYAEHEPANKDEVSLRLLERAFQWARQINPSQPLTAGVWIGQDWRKGESLTPLNRYMLEHSDVITFHSYAPLQQTQSRVEMLKSWGRPLICTEYMARTAGSLFSDHLPYFKEHRIGAIHWGLVAGKSQTQYPWQSWDKTFTEEPTVWFHDVFRPDGTPFDAAEVALFKTLTEKQNVGAKGKSASKTTVKMTTSMGVIVIELDAEKAPITVENFLTYVQSGFYGGTIFHRIIPGFMIQGGGFTVQMQQKPTRAPIKNEAANGLKNLRGTIAMARTNLPDSATSQFFINHRDNPALDYRGPQPQLIGYAVFGKVVSGMEVVDRIAAVQTSQRGPHGDVPITPVIIESVEVVN